MTAARLPAEPEAPVLDTCSAPCSALATGPPGPGARDAGWPRAARQVRWLALGQPGVDVHRGRHRAVAGAGGRVGRADRMGAGQRGGGTGQRHRRLAVHRVPHPVPGRGAPRPARRRHLVLAAGPLHRRGVPARPARRPPCRHDRHRDGADRRRAAGDAAARPRQAQARGPARLCRHGRRGHPELPVRRAGRRSAGQPGRYGRLARRLVAGPGHRPGHRRRIGPGRQPGPGAAKTAAADSGDRRQARCRFPRPRGSAAEAIRALCRQCRTRRPAAAWRPPVPGPRIGARPPRDAT